MVPPKEPLRGRDTKGFSSLRLRVLVAKSGFVAVLLRHKATGPCLHKLEGKDVENRHICRRDRPGGVADTNPEQLLAKSYTVAI